MYSSHSLRAAARVSRGTVPRSALGPFGGGGGGASAAPGCGRSFSATSGAGGRGVGMEQPKQTQQQDTNSRDGAHKGHWDPMAQSFGEAYSTRADEEGFGTVYRRDDDKEHHGHPEDDTSQGCEVREKEKGRHLKDDKHAG